MNKTIEIRIKDGVIRGKEEAGSIAFKGIPFAKPPIGELRFKAPVSCGEWEGVLDCTEYGPRRFKCRRRGVWIATRQFMMKTA